MKQEVEHASYERQPTCRGHLPRPSKEVDPKVPVMMLTGFGEVLKASEEHLKVVDSIVSKPITGAALRQAISELLA